MRQAGFVTHARFREARTAKRPNKELLQRLNKTVSLYHEALELLPADAIDDIAVTHHQLGLIYCDVGERDRAVKHYRESIHLKERAGNLYGAALTRFNVAVAFLNAGRQADALEYAEAALRGFKSYGERAAADIKDTRQLIAKIRGQ